MRGELHSSLLSALNPRSVADHLGIPVLKLTDFVEAEKDAVSYFLGNAELLSALTVFDGSRRLIVYNDRHSPGRTNADIAHELAHALLFHEPAPPLNASGSRNWNPSIEAEAVWLGAAILVPESAALQIVRAGTSIPVAAKDYGVSESVMVLRLNVTGARARIARTRTRYS